MSMLSIMQHALGLDAYGRGEGYRNHFVTGEGSTDWPHCMEAFRLGYMSMREGNELSGGDNVFTVTASGKAFIKAASPSPPILTRSQKRYRRYLDLDYPGSFSEFLRSDYAK
jgi:hypothetical protein